MKHLTDEQFFIDLNGEDDLGAVIRSQLHIEYELDQLLKKQIPNYSVLDKLHLDYEIKIVLAIAMELNQNYEKPLKGFGLIRNKFAHEPGFKLTKSDTNNLYNCFAKEDKEVIQAAFKNTNNKTKTPNNSFKLQDPFDQFILLAISMRQILIQAKTRW